MDEIDALIAEIESEYGTDTAIDHDEHEQQKEEEEQEEEEEGISFKPVPWDDDAAYRHELLTFARLLAIQNSKSLDDSL